MQTKTSVDDRNFSLLFKILLGFLKWNAHSDLCYLSLLWLLSCFSRFALCGDSASGPLLVKPCGEVLSAL